MYVDMVVCLIEDVCEWKEWMIERRKYVVHTVAVGNWMNVNSLRVCFLWIWSGWCFASRILCRSIHEFWILRHLTAILGDHRTSCMNVFIPIIWHEKKVERKRICTSLSFTSMTRYDPMTLCDPHRLSRVMSLPISKCGGFVQQQWHAIYCREYNSTYFMFTRIACTSNRGCDVYLCRILIKFVNRNACEWYPPIKSRGHGLLSCGFDGAPWLSSNRLDTQKTVYDLTKRRATKMQE